MGSDGGRRRKQVHHGCGYPLQSEVLSELVPLDDGVTVQEGSRVVVNYRNSNGILTWVCPGCEAIKSMVGGSVTGLG